VPEIINPVFTKTSPKRSFCMTKNERFGLIFTKTGSIISGTDEASLNKNKVLSKSKKIPLQYASGTGNYREKLLVRNFKNGL
jgi:hypothetical protein